MELLLICGICLAGLLAAAARVLAAAPAQFLPLVLAAFVPYFLAVWRAPRLEWRKARWLVLVAAVLVRLAFLTAPITLSDDVHRYLWEGQIQNAGFNPYRAAPDASELTGLRDANWQQVAHREVPTIYPPLLLLLFRATARAGHGSAASLALFKVVFTAFDLATIWLLVQLLRARGQNESLALIWAWNPLVILEFAGSAHEMSLAIACFVAGLWWLTPQRSVPLQKPDGRAGAPPSRTGVAPVGSRRSPPFDFAQGLRLPALRSPLSPILAGAAFGAAIMAQLLALPLVAAVAVAARVKSARFWVALGLVVAGSLALFASAGSSLLLGLANFAGRWRFNGSLFEILVKLGNGESPHQVFGGVWMVYAGPKRLAAIALVAVGLWTWWRRYRPTRAALAVAAALLLLSPVVHPWYVTWLVALAVIEMRLAWLAWSALVLVAYGPRLNGMTPATMSWLEYGPLFGVLLGEWWRRGRLRGVSARH